MLHAPADDAGMTAALDATRANATVARPNLLKEGEIFSMRANVAEIVNIVDIIIDNSEPL